MPGFFVPPPAAVPPEQPDPTQMVNLIRLQAPAVQAHAANQGLTWVGDGKALLGAIAENESGFDGWDPPRCEPAYYNYPVPGRYWRKDSRQQQAVKRWGALAACSWGPFQILAYNCYRLGYPLEESPFRLWWPAVSLPYVVALVAEILATQPPSPAHFGDAYNSGQWRDPTSAAVQKYREDFAQHFATVIARRGL